MGVIYWFSSRNGDQSSALSGGIVEWFLSLLGISIHTPLGEVMHTLVRKAAHFTEYLILAVLAMNTCGQFSWKKPWRVLAVVLFCAVYAITDEWHQSFVGGRGPRVMDVVIDTAGALTGAIGFQLLSRRKERLSQRESHDLKHGHNL
ncbi:MAG: VanZ family protein [Firmicutes bacterium]|nr:VanZ family protein [Bacillota bacterium]